MSHIHKSEQTITLLPPNSPLLYKIYCNLPKWMGKKLKFLIFRHLHPFEQNKYDEIISLGSACVTATTLRMLGATYKNVKSILDIELFVNSSLAYIASLTIIYIIKSNIIKLKYLPELMKYLGIKEYILMYIILLLISRLISRKVSKSLFKDTAINTYNEEV